MNRNELVALYAGLAMQAIVNSPEFQAGTWTADEIAGQSFNIAERMADELAQRTVKP